MLCYDFVEELVVPGLLVVHVLHQRAQVWVRAHQQRGLRSINQDGGELAGLVDTQGRGEEGALLLGELMDRFGRLG